MELLQCWLTSGLTLIQKAGAFCPGYPRRYVGYVTTGSMRTQGSYAMVGYYGYKFRPSQETPRT